MHSRYLADDLLAQAGGFGEVHPDIYYIPYLSVCVYKYIHMYIICILCVYVYIYI